MKTIILIHQATGARSSLIPVESLKAFVDKVYSGDAMQCWEEVSSDFVVVVTEEVEGDTYRSLLPVMSMQSLHDLFSGGAAEPSRVDRSYV